MKTQKIRSLFLVLVLIFILVGGGVVVGVLVSKNFVKPTVEIQTKTEVVDEETVVTRVVEKANQSVVTVAISKDVSDSSVDLFRQMFGFKEEKVSTTNIERDIGTGFIISEDGLIVTNKHVVSDMLAKYKVIIGKDETVDVVNIYRDPINDLAIIKINKAQLKPVEMGDSDKLKVGQTVIAIGTALGEFRSTVTKGVISGLGRGITAGGFGVVTEKLEDVIQVDAAINSGNSGGPLFDSSGKVIGVNVAVSQNGQNIGFALPINLVKQSVDNFKVTGEFDRPYLGISYQMISKEAALLNNVPAGAYIQAILENSPAQKSGLKVGDIITEIDGNKLIEMKDVSVVSIVNQKKIGESLKIKYYREKKEAELSIVLEKKN